MPRGLNNKVALITGAAQGIGRGIALRLAQEGVHILPWSIFIKKS
ncbi:SDR family NAD(P)-dependent oxidoreductase [Acinetobacter amyesii]